jgi:hypothetical protein
MKPERRSAHWSGYDRNNLAAGIADNRFRRAVA